MLGLVNSTQGHINIVMPSVHSTYVYIINIVHILSNANNITNARIDISYISFDVNLML